MKPTGKSMVLSGVLETGIMYPYDQNLKTVLEYSNVLDITKAWRVKDFKVWLKSTPEEIGIANWGYMAIRYQLNTDSMVRADFWDAADNRAIAFGEVSYGMNSYNDKQTFGQPTPATLLQYNQHIQPDHTIQNQLDLAAEVVFPEAGGMLVDLNYIIYLE
ncbi:unnamed protein product, partial [marine sediment metagenome]